MEPYLMHVLIVFPCNWDINPDILKLLCVAGEQWGLLDAKGNNFPSWTRKGVLTPPGDGVGG